jgi:hypothetical protein
VFGLRRARLLCGGTIVVGVALSWGSGVLAEPSALERFAALMARGDYGAAWERLAPAEKDALPKEAFVARYEGLATLPWVRAVLRSARVEQGRFVALDWSEARLAGARLLADDAALRRLRSRGYGVRSTEGGVDVGIARARRLVPSDTASWGTPELRVRGTSVDWFARYAHVVVDCGNAPKNVFVLATLESGRRAQDVALDCGARGGRHDVVLSFVGATRETSERPREHLMIPPPLNPRNTNLTRSVRLGAPKTSGADDAGAVGAGEGHALRARRLGFVSLGSWHPFAAPPPALVAHGAFPASAEPD